VTAGRSAGPGLTSPPPGSAWRRAGPELAIAVAMGLAMAGTGYAVAGVAGASLVVAVSVVAGLATIRALIPLADAATGDDYLPSSSRALPFAGYWRKRRGLSDGISSMSAYDAELRVTLQELLAARLAEKHGISLQSDPAAARRVLCPGQADQSLWFWIDPDRPATSGTEKAGIPPRTLARLIERLERL
jgi:hypothetical protein